MSARNVLEVLKSRLSPAPNRRRRRVLRGRISAGRLLHLESLESRRLLAFDLAANFAVNANPQAMIAEDFNRDGWLDLATVNSTASGSVSVLLGKADGTYQPAQNSPTGNSPTSIAVGDFDSDGNLDLATSNLGGNDVSVLLGNGSGGFAAPRNAALASGHTPVSVAVGDFNADGKMDLAVGAQSSYYVPPWGGCGYYGCYGGGGYSVSQAHVNVLIGTGDGGFGAQNAYDLDGDTTLGVAVADFNGDGNADIAAAAHPVQILLGNGDGTLQTPKQFGSYGHSVAIGDVNSDGKLDVVTPNGSVIGVSLGDGLGAFGAPQYFEAGGNVNSVAIADFNADGKVDLVASDNGWNTVNVLLGAGAAGTIAFKPPLRGATGAGPLAVVVGDFNVDGRKDVASANFNAGNVSVLVNDGTWPALNAPSISVKDVTVTEGNTGTVRADFIVSLSAAYSESITVSYATANGSATAGSDYQATSGEITFSPGGATSQTISVLVNGDRVGEQYVEAFTLNLSDAVNAFVSDPAGIGWILDDEPYLSIENYEDDEGNTGNTTFTFTVSLSAIYDAPVTVNYATADLTEDWLYYYGYTPATAGVDYTATSGTLTIPAGQPSGTIKVAVTGDRTGEPYEYFLLDLSDATNAQLSATQALGTIRDDEPYVSINSGVSSLERDSGTSSMTFTVSLSAAYDADVTVDYATSDGTAVLGYETEPANAGSDYTAKTGKVTIPAGETTQEFSVPIHGDLLAESNETFSVSISNPINSILGNVSGFATILDDDTPPTISIDDAWLSEGNSGTSLMTFTVNLSNASGEGVWVNFKTVNGTAKTGNNDYEAKSGTIYFAPGETTKHFTVSINGDKTREKDEKFFVNLLEAIGASITDSQGVGLILNDDGNTRNSRNKSAAAVDAVMTDWDSPGGKKRVR